MAFAKEVLAAPGALALGSGCGSAAGPVLACCLSGWRFVNELSAVPADTGRHRWLWACMASRDVRRRRGRGDWVMAADPSGSGTGSGRAAAAGEPLWRACLVALPAAGWAAGIARRRVRDALQLWGLAHLNETGTLLVSELVGNAVRHARTDESRLELRLEVAGTWLRIEVSDGDPRPPRPCVPSGLEESGFGFVLVDRIRILGSDHPDTLTSRANLGLAYQDAGRLGEAIALNEQNLTELQRILGPDHPLTLTSRGNLALAYQAAGRLGEAILLLEQALASSERVLGTDHPTTRKVLEYLWRARHLKRP